MAGDEASAALLGVRVGGGRGLASRAQELGAGRDRAAGLTVAWRVQRQRQI